MSTHCSTCGNPVPEGQFRCGRCGAPQDGDDADSDLEIPAEADDSSRSSSDSESPAPEPTESEPARAGAVSLPPPAGDDDLEVDHGELAAAQPSAPTPGHDPFGREDDTEKRRVPKGAFGEGSVVDVLPTAPEEERARHAGEDGDATAAEAPRGEATGKVARLAGLEPTRHAGDDQDDDDDDGDGDEPAAESRPRPEARSADSSETPLELDVPSGGIRSLPHKPRPPFLASELMREDIIPERPGGHAIARLSQSCGVAAVVFYMLLAVARPDASYWGVPALLLLGLGVARLGYLPRAMALAVLALGSCVACLGSGHYPGTSENARYLPFVVLWLSAALLLRFWYRGHRQPPWLVATGVAAAAALGFGILDEAGPWVLSGYWQSWLPALIALLYAQLCLLSLFAFMGPETNAAGATWALAWWGWNAAAYLILALAGGSPPEGSMTLAAAADALTQSGMITIFVVPPGAFALAQLYAVALSRHEPEAADDPHIAVG